MLYIYTSIRKMADSPAHKNKDTIQLYPYHILSIDINQYIELLAKLGPPDCIKSIV